jgi:thiol:disulfide interchange protein DsbA
MKTSRTMNRRLFLGALGALIGQTALPLRAAPEGKGYKVLQNPVATETGARIEVLELFWYRCPHCFQLEPDLVKWAARLPADVALRRMPAVFSPTWAELGKAYYALEALGQIEAHHSDLFEAIHLDGKNLQDERLLFAWAAQVGMDPKKFADAYRSFAVSTKIGRAQQLTREYQVDGVPALIVGGRYVTSVSMAGDESALFNIVDELIGRVRAEKKKK